MEMKKRFVPTGFLPLFKKLFSYELKYFQVNWQPKLFLLKIVKFSMLIKFRFQIGRNVCVKTYRFKYKTFYKT